MRCLQHIFIRIYKLSIPSAALLWSQGINSAPCAACRVPSSAPEGAVAVDFADFVKIFAKATTRKVLGKM